VRISPDGTSRVLCAHNVSAEAQSVPLHLVDLGLPAGQWRDLLTGEEHTVEKDGHALTLPPYGLRWLKI
jgi:hypothetical protein